MRRFAVLIIASLALAPAVQGCARMQAAYEAATQATVSPQAVVIAVNSFNVLEATATNYLRLRRCSPTTTQVCRNPEATRAIIPAVRAGRVARDNLIRFVREHPGQLGAGGLIDALETVSGTITAIYDRYGVQRVQ